MKNWYLSDETTESIDRQVEKVLAELERAEPPLNLTEVREALCLDKKFYSADDPGVLGETIHRLKVAGKQIMKRPGILADAIKKWKLSALWLPDRKRILIDSAMPKLKQRWGEAHEIGHSIIPWHEPLMHGDAERTLSAACRVQIEGEANCAAGRLLFVQSRFDEEVRSERGCLDSVRRLSKVYGNTMTSTLWRTVEALAVPAFGMVSIHPREEAKEGQRRVRYFMRSRAFEERFGAVSSRQIFEAVGAFCFRKRGPIGEGEVWLEDDDEVEHVFFAECFNNNYDTLTLGIHKGLRKTRVVLR